jgi:O-antigen ligase
LRSSIGRLSAGHVAPVAVGVTVFAFACGSSSVHVLNEAGKPLRWAALFVLLVLAALWTRERAPLAGLEPVVTGSALLVLAVALASTLWSVTPRLTFERAVSFAVLIVVAALIAHASVGGGSAIGGVVAGLLGGSAAVAIAGLIVLAVSHHDAVEVATSDLPARYKGMGENPNTASLLFALGVPLAAWFLVRGSSVRARILAGAAVLLLTGSIVASGSHGALVATAVGTLPVALLAPGGHLERSVASGVLVAVVAVGFWIQTLPQPSLHPRPAPGLTRPPAAKPGYIPADVHLPLDGELGIPLRGVSLRRSLFTSSGRRQAWGGAVRQAAQRPVAGYGFGTESKVFVDRWSGFVGAAPENSYIGLALQLGVAGLVTFAILLAALARAGLRALVRRRASISSACLGAVVAGLVIAVVQSYIYSAGNIATSTLWIAAFLLPAVAASDA